MNAEWDDDAGSGPTTGGRAPRIAVAAVIQESNTFSRYPSTLADFEIQGLWLGREAADRSAGSNTEIAGALTALAEAGAIGVPLLRAWAMSGGVLDEAAYRQLETLLVQGLRAAVDEGGLDAVVLCLHGALVADHEPAADAALVEAARSVVGPAVPLIVTHDLHANVTQRIVTAADAVIGFHTYPHVDQGDTGRRGAALALRAAGGARLRTVLAKRPMVIPAEAQAIDDPPMAAVRAAADAATGGEILDVSLFPVQPWLDVPELGFGVTVTTAGDPVAASTAADQVVETAWRTRSGFAVEPLAVAAAIDRARALRAPDGSGGCVLLLQSADSPTSGATADDASVIAALLTGGAGLTSLATVVDIDAVAACHAAGVGASVELQVGAGLDGRWSKPVRLTGRVVRTGAEPVVLAGAAMTGQEVSMGRWATVAAPTGLTVLLTERPAPTFDPAGYRAAGLEPAAADVVVVRSATLYRAGFRGLHREAILLDLPGASTPRLSHLSFVRAPRPLFPLDRELDPVAPEGRVDR